MSGNHKVNKRRRLWERQKRCCAYCGMALRFSEATIDHIIPKCLGGGWVGDTNVVCACQKCNARKSNRSVSSFIAELVVERFLGIAA